MRKQKMKTVSMIMILMGILNCKSTKSGVHASESLAATKVNETRQFMYLSLPYFVCEELFQSLTNSEGELSEPLRAAEDMVYLAIYRRTGPDQSTEIAMSDLELLAELKNEKIGVYNGSVYPRTLISPHAKRVLDAAVRSTNVSLGVSKSVAQRWRSATQTPHSFDRDSTGIYQPTYLYENTVDNPLVSDLSNAIRAVDTHESSADSISWQLKDLGYNDQGSTNFELFDDLFEGKLANFKNSTVNGSLYPVSRDFRKMKVDGTVIVTFSQANFLIFKDILE
jgi:hypothetical protein